MTMDQPQIELLQEGTQRMKNFRDREARMSIRFGVLPGGEGTGIIERLSSVSMRRTGSIGLTASRKSKIKLHLLSTGQEIGSGKDLDIHGEIEDDADPNRSMRMEVRSSLLVLWNPSNLWHAVPSFLGVCIFSFRVFEGGIFASISL